MRLGHGSRGHGPRGRMRGKMMQTLEIPCESTTVIGSFHGPADAGRLILIATVGSGNHLNPRYRFLARNISGEDMRVLLFDLLTEEEGAEDRRSGRHRNQSGLLAARLAAVTHWAGHLEESSPAALGLFGTGAGGNAALMAAGALVGAVHAVAVADACVDISPRALAHLRAATLLICGGADDFGRRSNEVAFSQLGCVKDLRTVAGAEGMADGDYLETVSELARAWFRRHLKIPKEAKRDCDATLPAFSRASPDTPGERAIAFPGIRRGSMSCARNG